MAKKGRGELLWIQAGKKLLLNNTTVQTIKAKSCSQGCWNDPWDFPSIQKGVQRLQMEDREGQGERNEEGQGFAPPAFTVMLAGSWRDGGRGGGTNGRPSCQKSHTKSLSICPTWQLKLQPPSVVLDQ